MEVPCRGLEQEEPMDTSETLENEPSEPMDVEAEEVEYGILIKAKAEK